MLRRILDSPWLYFSLAGVLLVATVLSQFRYSPPEKPTGRIEELSGLREREPINVVFILIDTLRSDRLSAYGYARKTSPHIDALAERGIRFETVEGQSSWTKASMASLWTGMYPERTGVQQFAHALPGEAVLPAERFSEAGYATAGVWRNGWVANSFGFGQGFDLYVRPSTNRPVQNVKRNNPSTSGIPGTDRDATESAMEFILGHVDRPFFLYLHYMDVHQYLYADTSPDWGASFSDIYDSAIHWTDSNVGALVETLRGQDLLDNTVIVIAADHGEAFFEHGGEGHARTLYREVQQVPLIISLPFDLEPGVVVTEPVANVDIWPTVLDLLGLPGLPGAEGRSLVPLVLEAGGASAVDVADLKGRSLYAQLDRSWGKSSKGSDPIVSLLKGNYRMIQSRTGQMEIELYDRSVDPGEHRNLALERGDDLAPLQAEVSEFLTKKNEIWGESPEIEIDEMQRVQLRALGYVLPATDRRLEAQRKAAERKPVPPPSPK